MNDVKLREVPHFKNIVFLLEIVVFSSQNLTSSHTANLSMRGAHLDVNILLRKNPLGRISRVI